MKGSIGKTWQLFREFFVFGCFTFGGGWAIVAQMQRLYVEKKQEITNEELVDLTSLGRSLPGVMIGNIATLYGYRVSGIPGAIASAVGMITPPFIVMCFVAFFYISLQDNALVMALMQGIRAAIVPIIGVAALKMTKGSYIYPPCYAVTALAFILYFFLDVSPVYLVLLGVVAGLLMTEYYERKGAEAAAKEDAAADNKKKEEEA